MTDTPQIDNPEAAAAAVQAMVAPAETEAPVIPAPAPGFVRLPCGVSSGMGDTVYDAEVRELTGADEEFIDRVRRGAPGKLVEAILERGVRTIDGKPAPKHLLRELLIGDVNALLVAVRESTYGPEIGPYEGLICPHCKEEFDLTLEVSDIPQRPMEDTNDRYFTVDLRNGRTANCRMVRLGDLPDANADATSAEYNTLLLSKAVLSVDEPGRASTPVGGSTDAARALNIADRRKILVELGKRNAVGPDLSGVKITHETCGEEVPYPLEMGDLFPGL